MYNVHVVSLFSTHTYLPTRSRSYTYDAQVCLPFTYSYMQTYEVTRRHDITYAYIHTLQFKPCIQMSTHIVHKFKKKCPPDEQVRDMRWLDETVHPKPSSSWRLPCLLEIFSQVIQRAAAVSAEIVTHYDCAFHPESTHCTWPAFATQHACESTICSAE